jgi:hypothetical protein
MKNERINRRWFKNQLEKGNILVKCNGKYTDDYAFDNAFNFFINDEWTKATAQKFCDWYIKCMHLYGDKSGIISGSFASCEYWSFKLKSI